MRVVILAHLSPSFGLVDSHAVRAASGSRCRAGGRSHFEIGRAQMRQPMPGRLLQIARFVGACRRLTRCRHGRRGRLAATAVSALRIFRTSEISGQNSSSMPERHDRADQPVRPEDRQAALAAEQRLAEAFLGLVAEHDRQHQRRAADSRASGTT